MSTELHTGLPPLIKTDDPRAFLEPRVRVLFSASAARPGCLTGLSSQYSERVMAAPAATVSRRLVEAIMMAIEDGLKIPATIDLYETLRLYMEIFPRHAAPFATYLSYNTIANALRREGILNGLMIEVDGTTRWRPMPTATVYPIEYLFEEAKRAGRPPWLQIQGTNDLPEGRIRYLPTYDWAEAERLLRFDETQPGHALVNIKLAPNPQDIKWHHHEAKNAVNRLHEAAHKTHQGRARQRINYFTSLCMSSALGEYGLPMPRADIGLGAACFSHDIWGYALAGAFSKREVQYRTNFKWFNAGEIGALEPVGYVEGLPDHMLYRVITASPLLYASLRIFGAPGVFDPGLSSDEASNVLDSEFAVEADRFGDFVQYRCDPITPEQKDSVPK